MRVRRALTHAIDRELIVKTILDGLAPVVARPDSAAVVGVHRNVTKYAFDPAQARALLDEAGWTTGGDGMRAKDGKPLAFTLITQAGFAIRENVAQALQRQFRDVGVDVKVQLIDGTSISALWFEGKFDAMLHWWQMPADPEITLFFAADRTPPRGPQHQLPQGRRAHRRCSTRPIARSIRRSARALLGSAQQRIAELAAGDPALQHHARSTRCRRRCSSFKGNPTNAGSFWNVHEWDDPSERVAVLATSLGRRASRRPFRCCSSSRCSCSR